MLRQKKVYIEYIRCLACALVIFNHLSGYALYQVSHGWKQFMYMSLTMFTRINVPLFFMISGALLFEKEESIDLVLKKRALRIFLDIVIFQFLMFTLNHIEAIRDGWDYDYSVGNYIRVLITNGVRGAYAYWYMYSYLVSAQQSPQKPRTAVNTRGERLRCFEFNEMAGICSVFAFRKIKQKNISGRDCE